MKTHLISPRAVFVLLFLTGVFLTSRAGESTNYTNGKNAASVMGKNDFSLPTTAVPPASRSVLGQVAGIARCPLSGKIFVSVLGHHRVLRFSSEAALTNGALPEAVLGQADFDSQDSAVTRSGMDAPYGLVVDNSGRLWVADSGNNRVLRFDNARIKLNGADANGVFGQPDFTSNAEATTDNGMNEPAGLAIDNSGALWVADSFNRRVLRFNVGHVGIPVAPATLVLGQDDFTSSDEATSAAGMDFPTFVSVDSSGHVWVADSGNNRILRFDSGAAKSNGDPADGVLGQADFTSSAASITSMTMSFPQGLGINGNGSLWVADVGNRRLLRFDSAATKVDGAAADGVLGQSIFTTNNDPEIPDRGRFQIVVDIETDDDGNVWATDRTARRVLRFTTDSFQPDGLVGSRRNRLKGNNRYNLSGAGQKITTRLKGKRSGKVFLTIQNDGDVPDGYQVRATKGNRKLKVTYRQTPGGNVTGAITRGRLSPAAIPGGSFIRFKAIIKGTRASKGKRASRNLRLRATSLTDGETDTVKARIKKTP